MGFPMKTDAEKLAAIRQLVDGEMNAELPAELDPMLTRITPAKQIDIAFLVGKGSFASDIHRILN